MSHGNEAISALMFAVAVLLLKFNPITLVFNFNAFIGILLIIIFGALIAVSGIVNMPSYYTAPVAALGILDIRMAGLFLFAFIGSRFTYSEDRNLIKPKMKSLARAAFAGYILFVLISVITIYPFIEFKIPSSVSGMAVQLLVPAIGCDSSYTGQECLDSLVTKTIDKQCGGNSGCISLLNEQRQGMEDKLFAELSNQFPGFSRSAVIGEVLQKTLNLQIKQIIQPYQGLFKMLMAFVIFTAFQFLKGPLSLLSGITAKLLLKFMESTGLVKKEVKQVDKIIFST